MSEADQELENVEYKDFKDNAQLKAIIAGQKAKTVSIRLSDIEIFIRPAIPKGLRDRIWTIAKEYEAGEIQKADAEIYDVVSQMCLNEPYTNPEVWKYIDAETGEVPNVLKAMIDKTTEIEDSAKRFRGKH